jgi:hypothetical protein
MVTVGSAGYEDNWTIIHATAPGEAVFDRVLRSATLARAA